jgi:hypothetical protein
VIEQRFIAQWTVSSAYRCAVQFPSVLGLIDTDKTTILSEPPTDDDWLKLDIVDGDTEAAAYCPTHGLNRVGGFIQLTIFSPKQAGDKQLFTLGGLAKAIFNRHLANGLRCEASSLEKITPEGGWNRAVARTPFEYYEEVA